MWAQNREGSGCWNFDRRAGQFDSVAASHEAIDGVTIFCRSFLGGKEIEVVDSAKIEFGNASSNNHLERSIIDRKLREQRQCIVGAENCPANGSDVFWRFKKGIRINGIGSKLKFSEVKRVNDIEWVKSDPGNLLRWSISTVPYNRSEFDCRDFTVGVLDVFILKAAYDDEGSLNFGEQFAGRSVGRFHGVQLVLKDQSSYNANHNQRESEFINGLKINEQSYWSPVLCEVSDALKNGNEANGHQNNHSHVETADFTTYDGRVIPEKDIERGTLIILGSVGAIWYCFYYAYVLHRPRQVTRGVDNNEKGDSSCPEQTPPSPRSKRP